MKKFLFRIAMRYKGMYMSNQILIYLALCFMLPMICLSVFFHFYYAHQLSDSLILTTSEIVKSKGGQLQGYMQTYMKPFYYLLIDKRIPEILSKDLSRAMKAYHIFSVFEDTWDSSNNDLVLLYLQDNQKMGYLYARSFGKKVVVNSENAGNNATIVEIADVALNKDNLCTKRLVYNGKECIAVSRRIKNFRTQEVYGSVVMLLLENNIKDMIDHKNQNNLYRYYTFEADGEILFSDSRFNNVKEHNNEVSLKSEDILWTNWSLSYIIDIKAIIKDTWKRIVITSIIFLTVYLVMAFFLCKLIKHRFRTLDILQNVMGKMKNEGQYHFAPEPESGEFQSLFLGYNAMISEIQKHEEILRKKNEENIYTLEKLRESELKALELEINPHFLYNTLNSINCVAIDNNDYETSSLIKHFSNMLRYLTKNRRETVTIEQEAEWLEEYLILQKNRFDNQFDFEIDVAPEVGKQKICKLILQPFVENAVLHGFNRLDRKGMLTIIFSEGEDKIKIKVLDNGHGMKEETLMMLRRQLEEPKVDSDINLGLMNTCYRMKMYYGEEFSISVSSREEMGTEFILTIPHIKGESNDESGNH